ncbi:hypothetical protein A8M77_09660 [Variovorax sp. JS1663]|nr:hypothetical protein A8M77_09660 [Variovorax sp. JS1663]
MPAKAFTPSDRAAIDALRMDLARRTHSAIVAEYGSTEDGQFHDAALSIQSLPSGSWGRPGPLVTILAGPGIGGAGFAVMGADGSALAEGVDLTEALSGARSEGVRRYRKMSQGGSHAA